MEPVATPAAAEADSVVLDASLTALEAAGVSVRVGVGVLEGGGD